MRMALLLAIGSIITLIVIPVQFISIKLNLPWVGKVPMLWHRLILWLLGVRVHQKGTPSTMRPLLLTPTHSSWLDILIMGSLLPCSFVSKSEVANWPLFGLLSHLQRTIFVERERQLKTGETVSEIANRLDEGSPIILFAEGTSSDGNRVLPFKSALIGSAQYLLSDSNHDIVYLQPVTITFTHIQGIPMGRQFRPIAAWPGDTGMVSHLKGVIAEGAIDVLVSWGEVITIDDTTNRKQIAKKAEKNARQMMSSALTG